MPYLLTALIAGLISFGSTWYVLDLRFSKQIAKIEKTHQEKLDSIADEQVKNEKTLRKQYETALNKSIKRQRDLGIDAVASSSALIGLSNAADAAITSSRNSLDACNATANTFRIVFGYCSERYNKVAGDAQGHVVDKQSLIESYPTLRE
jgi:hypothetical protein